MVDDSAYVRKTLGSILSRSPHLEVVGYAGDGLEALEQVQRLRPDVVTVDLEMPVMDGVEFIEEQMRRHPLPIVVVSAVDPEGRLAGASMKAGAVEFVLKPTHLADQRLADIEGDLLRKVHAVAEIAPAQLKTSGSPADTESPPPAPGGACRAVVIGVSTGGPQLLHQVLPRLPADLTLPLALVIHMPVGFTKPLSDRLDANCAIEIREAKDGMAMKPGRCLVGRAGQDFVLEAATDAIVARNTSGTGEGLYRPSVDQLFRSASICYGGGLVGVVLTGMGHDGREGAAWIKANGGRVYTQTKDSCVVWGMPRAVQESGLSDGQLEPSEIARFIASLSPV